jgi:flavin-dependent dehydrogenase
MSQSATAPEPAQPAACEVLIVGAGPAGSTIATLLARQGRDVVLLEKEHHPRFHIGESLLPANVPLFEQLGVLDEVKAIGLPKWGVDFNSPDHAHQSFLQFGDAWDKSMPMAWQVRRAELDAVLFRNAARAGARALEGCQVQQIDFDAEGVSVHARLDDGAARQWRARFLIDASGRDTVLARQLGCKQRNPRHASAALFGHFRGARRLPGKLEGNISIFWFRHGWFWVIPLADGSTSVGAVCWPHYLKTRDKPLREFFMDTIAMSPPLAARLQDAELIDDAVHATGNYAYSADHSSGERYLMLGDAYAFVDPVFSSGVYFAMVSAFEGAKVVAASLDEPARAPAARKAFDALMQKGPREFSWFIYRMTSPAMRRLFLYPANVLRMQEAVLSLLAGDIYGQTPFWGRLRLFKLVYYIFSVVDAPRSVRAWWRRRRNIRDVCPLPGENVVEAAR